MSLIDKYNSSAAGTNAGNAKNIGTNAATLANYFDGTAREQNNAAPDEFQTGFSANEPGAFRYGGAGKVPGQYTLSAWLTKAVNKVDTLFSNPALNSLIKGDVRNEPNKKVHKFTPAAKFQDSGTLSAFAKSKTL